MKFYRYWACGSAKVRPEEVEPAVVSYAPSNESLADALRRANELAENRAAVLRRGETLDSYHYGDRAVREELLEDFHDATGLFAAITRNAYGAMVLNTAQVMFADIDYRPVSPAAGLRQWWDRLWGKPVPTEDEVILQRLHALTAAQPEMGLRVYRTANGYRCLVTHRLFDPLSDEAARLLTQLQSDPLYIKLCRLQECFRARVSPKPWRCQVARPPRRFPWTSTEQEALYRAWEADYREKSEGYTTCILVATIGSRFVAPAVQPVIDLHDGLSCRGELPLA